MIKILITLICTLYFSFLAHILIEFWQILPIEEERSTPIYITRKVDFNK